MSNTRWSLLLTLSLIFSIPASASDIKTRYCDFVNLFLGTSGDHGQVTPAACSPFGRVAPCPDSSPRQHAGYDHDVTNTSGISVNRLSGIGCSGCGGNLSIRTLPFGEKWTRTASTENAYPGFYETSFDNGDHVRLTATKSVSLEEFTFHDGADPSLYIDALSSFTTVETEYKCVSYNTIQGIMTGTTACDRGHYQQAFHITFSKPFRYEDLGHSRLKLTFKEASTVEVRIALSSFSPDDAKAENENLSAFSFDEVRAAAADEWESILSKIDVSGNDMEYKRIFYTSLYRACLSPAEVARKGMFYRATDGNIHLATHDIYASWSLWDTYRTKFTLLGLLCPELSRDIALSIADLYVYGKSDWSTHYEPAPTVRSEHAGILLLDYYKRGWRDIPFRDIIKGLGKEMSTLPMRTPDQKIEAVSDWQAYNAILSLSKTSDPVFLNADSLFEAVWRKEFMTITDDFTKMRGNGLYQGTRWQYRWASPSYIDKMAEWTGRDNLVSQLTTFFNMNLFNQGNEPDIHTPFIFNKLGRQDLTRDIVYRLLTDDTMTHIYGGNAEYKKPLTGRAFQDKADGYLFEMDEDDGTMSAWWAFCSMGLYPLNIGSDEYEITIPLFDEITMSLPSGKSFKIVNKQRKHRNTYTAFLNGEKLQRTFITQKEITNGGMLVFK